jgi:glycosyltransferase involved in cell wall biosynthesis
MNVLLMNQFFWPDSAATSQLLTDVASDLVERGHSVQVICGGYYAETAAESVPAVSVYRVKGVRFSRGTFGRILSYATFYLGAAWRALTLPKPDVIMTLTTPPLLSVIGAAMKVFRGCRFCIWEMDLYPDVAIDLGYIKAGSVLDCVIGTIADWSRRKAEIIVVLGECMRARLLVRGIPSNKIAIVENWADGSQIHVSPHEPGRTGLHLVYSGNLGLAHDISTLISVIRELRHDARFRFFFIGGGARRSELSSFVVSEAITSVELQSYVARADLGASLGIGDIGLVTQRDACCGSVVPSKVYGLLAAGRPILFIGPASATPANIVRSHACGWHISIGDVEGLVKLLKHLVNHPEEVAAAGVCARKALEEHFDRSLSTSRIIHHLAGTASSPLNQDSLGIYSESRVSTPLRP